jgi:cytochrome c oxidase subunit III
MNSGAVLRVMGSGRDNVPSPPLTTTRRRRGPQAVYSVGLWVFIGVATMLFSLFITAYVMRMSGADAAAIAMPPQLWLSTAWLVLGSALLQHAGTAPAGTPAERTRLLLFAGGVCAAAFLGVQWWAWHTLFAREVTLAGNPAGSFFYLLTAMHGLHVAGGLAGWGLAARAIRREHGADGARWRIALCARYWHFLLLVWLTLFACFAWVTPEVARIICRTA